MTQASDKLRVSPPHHAPHVLKPFCAVWLPAVRRCWLCRLHVRQEDGVVEAYGLRCRPDGLSVSRSADLADVHHWLCSLLGAVCLSGLNLQESSAPWESFNLTITAPIQ